MVMIVAARSLGIAVSDATFLYGESRGGIMTFLALRNGLPVRAAATFGAITDLEAFLGVDDHAAALGPEIWPDFATNRALITEGRSAQRWPERIRRRSFSCTAPTTPRSTCAHAATATPSFAIVSNAIARRLRSSTSSCPASRNGERR